MELEKMVSEGIMAILPVYVKSKGNCCHILTYKGKTYELDKTLKTMLIRLSKYYFVDLKAVKSYYGNLLNIKNLIPIPFNSENIYIPLKIRKPICKNDGAIGYVNIKYICSVTKKDKKAVVSLANGYDLYSLNSIETVNKHIKNGNIIKKLFSETEKKMKNTYIIDEYDKPATKGDVVLIINEILRIKESIK